jgi:hypothetical protein
MMAKKMLSHSGSSCHSSYADDLYTFFLFRYIIDCIESQSKQPLRGYYFLSMSSETNHALKGNFDVFGDR